MFEFFLFFHFFPQIGHVVFCGNNLENDSENNRNFATFNAVTCDASTCRSIVETKMK